METLHGDGRILPEWPAADLDWLVRGALAALVSCRDGIWDAGAGVGVGVDAISAAAMADCMLFDCDAVQMGIILTANYAFLNYLVLILGFMLLDDRFVAQFLPQRWRQRFAGLTSRTAEVAVDDVTFDSAPMLQPRREKAASEKVHNHRKSWIKELRPQFGVLRMALSAVVLGWLFYASTAQMMWMIWRGLPLPTTPVVALEPFRIADRYGLFAVMTRGRYEIEFQGSADGTKLGGVSISL